MMGGSSSTKTPPATALRIQSSIAGLPITVGWGRTRVSGNLIWYGDFASHANSSGGGGKGGGGGGKGGSGSTTYNASIIIGISEGPISAVNGVWSDSTYYSLGSQSLGYLDGDYGQGPWSYLSSVYPSQALDYRGLAIVVGANISLGTSPNLPNYTFDVSFAINGAISGIDGANPKDVLIDYLTNPYYGVGFPSSFIGDLTNYSNYCIANGLVVSPTITTQTEARQFVTDLMDATNSQIIWIGGKLNVVPYGDTSVSNYGATYTAPSTALFSLSDIDYKSPQGGNNNSSSSLTQSDPVQSSRIQSSNQFNQIWIEFLDASNSYNPNTISASDDASINLYGLRKQSTKTLHFFTWVNAAVTSANLMLGRQAIRNTYAFTLGPEYIMLDPMDIIEINDPAQGLVNTWVRITEIQENNDYSLTFQAEDVLVGSGSTPLYSAQASLSTALPANSPPAGVITPVIWEPTYALAGGTEIWIAIGAPTNFGGADVYVSTDNSNYINIGRFNGNSRVGTLTATIPSVTQSVFGITTLDTTNTLSVDMSPTGAQLLSGTSNDAQVGNTLCYVGGEYISYETATLTSGDAYNLTYLVRGMYDSVPQTNTPGTPIVRLSVGTYFTYTLTADRIGQVLYFKILPFNQYGAGEPDISAVSPVVYTVVGTALAEVLAPPTNLTTSYIGSFTYLSWTEIKDWRAPVYEIRKGASWATALKLATVAHPPFLVSGNDTYWVAAVVTPDPALTVYSSYVDLSIQSSVLAPNVAAAWDELGTGWTGTLTGGAVLTAGTISTSGGVTSQVGGVYTIPTSHIVNVGRVCTCNVIINWSASSFPTSQNLIGLASFLTVTDFLGGASSYAALVYPEINISQDGTTWAGWQKYTPGAYTGMAFNLRMQVQTSDPGTIALLTAFNFAIAPPGRNDHYIGLSVPTGGLTITYTPDGSSTAAPFIGGPGTSTVPSVQGTILSSTSGDTLIISAMTVSGCHIVVQNAGTAVARTVNLLVEGY